LVKGNTRSCGCLQREVVALAAPAHLRTHGFTKHPLYRTWKGMHERCSNPKLKAWPLYGGRGVCVCARWSGPFGFPNFLEDMGDKPTPKHSIDRYPDPYGNYEPSNCRWATPKEQNDNQRHKVELRQLQAEVQALRQHVVDLEAENRRLKTEAIP
jgi:hypothetical protein